MVRIKRNDTRPLAATLTANGVPVPLTGATVRFNMTPRVQGTGTTISRALATITDAVKGKVSYAWTAPQVANVGVHRAEFEVTFSDGTVETFPNGEWIDLEIVGDLG